MTVDSDALEVRGLSLPRPLAGALFPGPCRVVNLPAVEVPRLDGGLLVAIHAQETWRVDDLAAVSSHWPECPQDPSEHPTGLLGVGLVERIEWYDAGGPVTRDDWAVGPWVLVLRETVRFTRPLAMLGYPGLFALPDSLASRLARAWHERPRT